MAQYREGTINLVNGSQVVDGNGTLWLSNIKPGNLLKVVGVDALFEVAVVVTDTQLQLTAPYSGATENNKEYAIVRDFTPSSIPYPTADDVGIPSILRRAFLVIDELISSGIGININQFTVTNSTGGNKTNWDTRDVGSGGDSTDGGGITDGFFDVYDQSTGAHVDVTITGINTFTTAPLPDGTVLVCRQFETAAIIGGGIVDWANVNNKPSLIIPKGLLDPNVDPLPGVPSDWDAYIISTDGSYDLGAGVENLFVDDWIIYDGAIWRVVVGKNHITWNEISSKPNVIIHAGDWNASGGLYPTAPQANYYYNITAGGILPTPTFNGVTEVFRGDWLFFDSSARWHHIPSHSYIIDVFLGRWLFRDTNFTASTKTLYRVDTTSSPILIDLPPFENVSDGDEIKVRPISDNVNINNITFNAGTNTTVEGGASFVLDVNDVEVSLIFTQTSPTEGNWDIASSAINADFAQSYVTAFIDDTDSPFQIPDTRNFTIVADTTNGPIQIDGPVPSANGQRIEVRDRVGTFSINSVTFVPNALNSETVAGGGTSYEIDLDFHTTEFLYDDNGLDWGI